MRQRSLTIVVLLSALVSAVVTSALTLGLDVPGPGGGPTQQAAAQAPASVPELVNFQGLLTDGSGNPLPQGVYTVTFRVFDVATGGTALWTEIQDVNVDDGLFHVLLGSVTSLTAEVFNGTPRYLEVKVGTDPPMTPRQQFTSVPYAFQAGSAESGVPSGTIILWDGVACPAGYTRVTSLDGKFLVSGTAYNPAAGGSNSHSHTSPSHTHGLSGTTGQDTSGDYRAWNAPPGTSSGNSEASRGWHSHSFSGTVSAGGGGAIDVADSRPDFATVLLCKKV